MNSATAIAHPNIALVKYWGKRDLTLNLPSVSSLSMTLDTFHTRTTVTWDAPSDGVVLNGLPASAKIAQRTLSFLDRMDPHRPPCHIDTHNTFPTGAGLASSASGFAALALAASAARGEEPDRQHLSVLARQGSGSACRSLWGGFVVWDRGERPDGLDSHGRPLPEASTWDLRMVVAIVTTGPKDVGSTEGMERSRLTSPLYSTWVEQAESDVQAGIDAVHARDLEALGQVMESSTLKMHASMMTSIPPLLYWAPATIACLHAIWRLRAKGVSAWCTMDAGPQVKVLCRAADVPQVTAALAEHAEQLHVLGQGGPARLEQTP